GAGHVAVAALELDRLGGDGHGGVRGGQLEDRRLDVEVGGPGVDQCTDVGQPGPGGGQVRGHVGDDELHALEGEDPPAELLAIVDVADGLLEGGGGDADRLGGDTRPGAVEHGEQDGEPVAQRAEHVL